MRSTSAGESDVWTVRIVGQHLAIESPTGESLRTLRSEDVLETLDTLSDFCPDINTVRAKQRTEIGCATEVENLLPLWLIPTEVLFMESPLDADEKSDLEYQLGDCRLSDEHFLTVNGDTWGVISSYEDSGSQDLAHVCLPLKGSSISDLFQASWASFSFSESSSRSSTPGWSEVGLVTPDVVMSCDVFNQSPAAFAVMRFVDRRVHIRTWLNKGELASHLRSTWTIGDEDDFIEWGFWHLANIKPSTHQVKLSGLPKKPYAESLGVGLTRSSEWIFSTDLPGKEMLEILGDMLGVRPGQFASDEAFRDAVRHSRSARFRYASAPPLIPDLTLRRVSETLSEPWPRDEIQRLRRRMAEEELALADKRAATSASCVLLGLEPGATRREVFNRVEHLVEADPERSADLWCVAYEALPPYSELLADLGKALVQVQKRESDILRASETLNWPDSWDARLAPLWLEYGGTAESVAAWHEAGWSVVDVLTRAALPTMETTPVEERVRIADVPSARGQG